MALCLASVLLFFLSYHVWWWLIFVALTPLVIGFCLQPSWRGTVFAAVISGWFIRFFTLYPLWAYSRNGVALLAVYEAVSFVPVAIGVRASWRRWRMPLSVSWPVAWLGAEYLRTLGPLGDSLAFLAGPCYEQTWMIQVCDLGGVYTLGVPIAMFQGWIADAVLHGHRSQASPGGGRLMSSARLAGILASPRIRGSAVAVAAAWCFVAGYGIWRLDQVAAEMQPGPRVAVIQPDVPYVASARRSYDPDLLLERLQALTEQAVRSDARPDLIAWPEGIAGFTLHNREYFETAFDGRVEDWLRMQPGFESRSKEELRAVWANEQRRAAERESSFDAWSRQLGAPLIVGQILDLPTSRDSRRPFLRYNAAQIYSEAGNVAANRQAKIRLYPLGEFVPWDGTWLEPLLGRWLRSFNRFTPGAERRIHRLKVGSDDGGGSSSYVISLCSEIMFSDSSGVFLAECDGKKPFTFLVNIANEGAFLRNRAQVCQFAFLPFRAVEARIGIARSSNTGISGFVTPTGRFHGLVTNGEGRERTGLGAPEMHLIADLLEFRRQHEAEFATNPDRFAELRQRIAEIESVRARAGVEGFSVAPIYTTARVTLYQRWGDWLGRSMLAGLAALVLAAMTARVRPVDRVASPGEKSVNSQSVELLNR